MIYIRTAEIYWANGSSKIVTQADLNGEVSFYANYPDFTMATISEFQIEKGTTTTGYVPYAYL